MENSKDLQPIVDPLNNTCYVFPQDIQDRMNNGEPIASESVTQFIVDEKTLLKQEQICFVTGHGVMTCACTRPNGTKFIGHGTTDIYSFNDHGTIKYCKTLFESCVTVCQRGT